MTVGQLKRVLAEADDSLEVYVEDRDNQAEPVMSAGSQSYVKECRSCNTRHTEQRFALVCNDNRWKFGG